MAWSDQAARYLRGSATCPRCERGPVGAESCPFCGAILIGPVADELRQISESAAALLDRRQEVIGRLGTKAALAPPPAGRPSSQGLAPAARVVPPPPASVARPASSSQLSLQSVLAAAGAALFGVAIIVFRFFSADVDLTVRHVVIAVVTLLFLALAWLLARIRLTFSAEAVGALAMVFVALDVQAIAELAPDGVSGWLPAAIGTLVAAVLTLVIAALVRLRVWLWLGLVGLVLVPAFLGYAVAGPWSAVIGHLGAVAVALLGHEVARRFTARYGSPLLADRVTTIVVAAVAAAVVLLGLLVVPSAGAERALVSSLVLAVLTGLAILATRTLAAAAWSAAAGVLGVVAVGILPYALRLADGGWLLALIPAATAVGLVVVAFLPWPESVHRSALRVGAVVVALLATVPAAVSGLTQLLSPLVVPGPIGESPDEASLWSSMERWSILAPTPSIAAVLGLAAATLGVTGLALAQRRASLPARPWLIVAAWLAATTLATLPAWSALSRPVQAILGTAIALALALLVVRLPRLRDAPVAVRAPFLAAAHGILLFVAVLTWREESLTVAAGAAAVVVLGVLTLAFPAVIRPLFVVVGYGYALVLLARGLDLLALDGIAVVSYTATAASLCALGVTLIPRVRPPLWYAVLGVTAVPFVIGVATVIAERTWETALANAAIFALALTLTLTRRPGLTRWVRAGAAALLLPSLAVVTVNVVPRLLETDVIPAWNGGGGAPVTLPIIATFVALVLPTTPLLAESLRRGELPEGDGRAVRLGIEVSAFTTSAIAALLALLLPTAGLGTALIVFVILAIGGAGAAIFAKRRYGWWLAAGAGTAALWCVWGLAGIADVEPYVYPPALGAVLVGTALALRGRRGTALAAPGLAIAVATSLVVLAASGSGPHAVLPWRALALLAGSLVLLAIGVLLDRLPGGHRLAALRLPALAVSIGAAAAGTVQAVRYAGELEPVQPSPADAVVLPVLGFSLAAAVLAGLAGRFLRPPERLRRWVLVPALVFLVVGPIAAVAPGVAPMWTLWGLMLALLAAMLVTVLRDLRGATILPPAALVFLVAWCVAVTGWSVRDLNVEWWSLPLGLALTGAGALVLARGGGTGGGTLVSWPVGFTRSWVVLAPGPVVTLLPSILATGTNPATWRAILVIALALVTLLAGSFLRYAAPFVLSLIAFGLEIVVVFLRLGADIDSTLLWITIGTAATIVIVIAVGLERRSTTGGATGARMRDLR